ncbi:hypothetical protein KC887_00945 [Candidatus Kaiserbacteria bacterium]|nr:hypothetical protein [Candidatus Kaiserbacteria bacterium]
MGKSVQNIAVLLGIATLAVAGYYLYTQQGATILQSGTDDAQLEAMLANTADFIEHRRELDRIALDLSLFEDQHFTSLRSFNTPVLEQPVGRQNPFAPANASVARPRTNTATP